MRSIVLSVVAVAAAAGCATESHVSQPAMPSFSTPSTSFQTSYVPSAPSHIERIDIRADLVVRPDRACVPLHISADAVEDGLAMKLVESEAARILAGAGAGAGLRADDIDAKSTRDDDGVRSFVSWRGVVEIELPVEADAWTRAKRVAALHRAVVGFATPPGEWNKLASAPKDAPPKVKVVVGGAEPGVRDIEQHRPKLLASWAERARALAGVVVGDVNTASSASLELLSCQPPAQVVVVGGTLEKVGLSLPVSCTFQARGSAR